MQYQRLREAGPRLVTQGQESTSLRRVATVLNESGIPTRRGGQWTAVQVQRLLAVI
ncbi:MAG: recombinase family protein [Terracidiphilus sp.]